MTGLLTALMAGLLPPQAPAAGRPSADEARRACCTAQVELSIRMPDETAADLRGVPAGADVRIYVDGEYVTRADDDGQASFTVPADGFELTAILPSTAIATAAVSIEAGETRAIELVLDDSKEVAFPATAAVSSMAGNLLPHDFSTFEIRLFRRGLHHPVRYISEIAIEDGGGNLLLALSDGFVVDPDGSMRPADVAALRQALMPYAGRDVVLKAEGEDAEGFTLTARKKCFIARHGPQVQRDASPSDPTLAPGRSESRTN